MTRPARPDRRPYAIVGVAGANLSLVHYVTLSEMGALLGASELVALLVLSAYFLGLSAGYLLSSRLTPRHLTALGAATLALHATLPFSARWAVATLWGLDLQALAPPFVFLLVLGGVTPFYAVFLPRLVDAAAREAAGGSRLVPLYATEIAGSVAGLLLAVLLTPARLGAILTVHLGGVVALLLLWTPRRRLVLARLLVPLVLIYAALYPLLDRASLAHFYEKRRKQRDVRVVASEMSPYQRVDIIESAGRGGPARSLYLDGNLFWGSQNLHKHNLFVSILPNLVLGRSTQALVVAGGSLDAARYLAPRVGHLRMVEVDEAVTRLAREHLQAPRGGFPENWDLVIDDGKHFLGNWTGQPFDVISVDVPLPVHLQTATLHAPRFFALARASLARGGIFSISLSGNYGPPDPRDPFFVPLEQRIMAGLYQVFRHVTVVLSGDNAYAWASDAPLGLDAEKIGAALLAFTRASDAREVFGAPDVTVLDDADARARAVGFAPIGDADMAIVLQLDVSKLHERYYAARGAR